MAVLCKKKYMLELYNIFLTPDQGYNTSGNWLNRDFRLFDIFLDIKK